MQPYGWSTFRHVTATTRSRCSPVTRRPARSVSRSEREWIRLVGVDPKVLHRLGRLAGRPPATAREGGHRRGRDMRPVDLEERAQGLTRVTAAEAVRSE